MHTPKPYSLWVFLLVFAAAGLVNSSNLFAGDNHAKSATHKMAEIILHLKHYPDSDGKKVLKTITDAKDSTMNERSIATAMMNLEHTVASSDVPKLKAIINNKKSTTDERGLAEIVLNLNHKPSNQDKAKLKSMMMMH